MKTRITAYCRIKNHQINLNGELVFSAVNTNFTEFSKKAYQELNGNYLKFFKMDSLSKLAFICTEFILKNKNLSVKYKPEEIAVSLCNAASSLDTDKKHNESIRNRDNYFPSPSVFVYTLPNIMVGEICIRNNFKGENSFMIFENFDSEYSSYHINYLFNHTDCKACVAGWVDFENENEDALLCIIEKSNDINFIEFKPETYSNLYFNN